MLIERTDALVVGGGQAGLATGHELGRVGVDHVILERDRVGSMWRGLWNGFHINTPNWSLMLPGHAYDGDDPDGFMTREGIVDYLDRYAQVVDSPVREGVGVTELRSTEDGFRLETTDGPIAARTVVLCTGAFQRAFRPSGADGLPTGLLAIDTRDYRDPSSLPEGAVLVVGNGQSGCQIAEELVDAGREVVLSCGRAAWAPRSVAGHDLVWWLLGTGFLDQGIDGLPSPAARLAANVTASGVGGGHDLHARSLGAKGVRLVGRFAGCEGATIRFEDDLIANVAWSDERYMDVRQMIEKLCAERGIEDPGLPDPEPFEGAAPDVIASASLGAVIFAGGFRSDYADWIDLPIGFDEMGFPIQRDGASSVAPGLFFAGVHFLRKRKSSLLCGVGEDAAVVADGVAEHLG
jgi:putative flavoprotein involved in K+ transport